MKLDTRAVKIACAMALLIAALVLMPRHDSDLAPTPALLSQDGLACARFGGQNQ